MTVSLMTLSLQLSQTSSLNKPTWHSFRDQIVGGPAQSAPEQPQLQARIDMGQIRQTPLNEFNRSQPLLSWAFPTLFPRGEADYVAPRIRTIIYGDYIKYAMRWRDGRSASHARLRFVAFNTLMRAIVNSKSAYFVRHAP